MYLNVICMYLHMYYVCTYLGFFVSSYVLMYIYVVYCVRVYLKMYVWIYLPSLFFYASLQQTWGERT